MTQSPRATIAGACLGMLAVGANGTAIMAALPTMRAELALNAGVGIRSVLLIGGTADRLVPVAAVRSIAISIPALPTRCHWTIQSRYPMYSEATETDTGEALMNLLAGG